MYALADDFGWAAAGWHAAAPEASTPTLDALAAEGVELDRMYSYKFCSPSRSAMQSGRSPIHVNVQNLDPVYANADDPVAGFAGIPRNMTGLGAVMAGAGYQTHFVGKWDVGMATPDHTPQGRGYGTSLAYFHHLNDYFTQQVFDTANSEGLSECGAVRPVDLWDGAAPARGRNGSTPRCAGGQQEYCFTTDDTPATAYRECPPHPVAEGGCAYEDAVFEERVLEIVRDHDTAGPPLFLFWALHATHAPLEVPRAYMEQFRGVATDDWRRQRYVAMARSVDDRIANVTALLQARGMWENTLLVFTSDNGGPIYRNGSVGASNYPLRGGKASNWEGGVRVSALAAGGAIPAPARGRRLDGLATLWDWYGTFARLAGVDPRDARAAAAGLPPVDSVDLWPWLSGAAAASPRDEVPLGSSSCVVPAPGCINEWGAAPSATVVNGLIRREPDGGGLWKLLVGPVPMNGWQGPRFPNASTTGWAAEASIHHCEPACLFELDADPTEHVDLAKSAAQGARVRAMLARLRAHNATVFSPVRGAPDLRGACRAATATYGGFWGPWIQ